MKKKKCLFNSKILFTIFVLCCFMATSLWAARKVELSRDTKHNFIKKLNKDKNFESTALASVFGLTADEKLKVIRDRKDFNKVTHKRYVQTYKDIPLWGMQTIISTNLSDDVVRLHGNVVLDIPNEIGNIPKKLDPLGALRDMQEEHRKTAPNAMWNFENEEYGTYIYFNNKGKAKLCYVVSFFADNETGNPSRMVYFIDAKNNKIIHSYNNLQDADGTGPGGNLKIGYYYYGTDYPAFGVTANGSTCTMDFDDCRSVNLNHGTSGTTPYSYTCYENTFKQINGAYSPINDAQFFGQVIYDMFQDWYGLPVLPFQLMMRVHYSTNYENAFWNGSSMTFGDGYTTFHPLVCLDVSAHEVAHGFTDNHSDLIYSGQSGGINESYSDMAGEGAKYYMRGTNDFMCGYDIFKAAGQALRYLYDPPLDGQSIDHVDDYYSGMDVHYSSGIFNKAFYLIATSPGWNTHMAFDIFTKANTDYWGPSTNFVQGAEGAQDAAADYGYSCTVVRDAFAQVGITLVCAGPPVADFSGAPTTGGAPLIVNFTDLSSNDPTSWSWSFPGGTPSSSTAENPTVTYNSPGNYNVTLTASNASGSDGETKTNYITVTTPQPPVADFTASSTNITVGDSVNFTDLTTENPTSWSWTFDGGTPGTSTAQNPTVTYNTAGSFTVSLTAGNAQGSDTETKVGYINVAEIPYCTSSGNSQSYEYISGVIVADLNNTSGASGYSDFTSLTASITQEASVSVSLTPGFPGSSYTEWWRIWIDYNGDHDFADAGEQVFSGSGSSVVNGNFTVPAATIIGTTRMRVSMSYSTYPPVCGTFTYGEVEDYTVDISGTTPPDPPVADFTASATTINEGDSVAFTDLSTNTPTSWSWSFPGGTPSSSTAQNPTVVYNTAGTYDVTLTATNAGGSDGETKTDYITVEEPPPGLTFESGTVAGVGSSWQNVTLANTYTSPVVVCSTGISDSSDLPVVVRVRNASGNSFDVMVQNPSGTALSGHTVHYVVVEEGVYTAAEHGVTLEAKKANSTVTASQGAWTPEPRSYQNTYTNPVVVGQVMTYNDAGWSVFWACGSDRANPPSASAFNAGKEVAEDTDKTRANETIGYIVIEQGSGTINSIPYTAALGADTVRGPDNTSTGYTYTFGSIPTASVGIVSAAAIDGGNGGWPVLYGASPLTSTSITMVCDEDQIADSERAHTTEQMAYIVFGQ